MVWFGGLGNFQSTKIFFAMTEGGRFLTVSKKTVLLLATCCSSQWEAATKILTITITIINTVLLLAACCSTRWGVATKTPLTKMGFSLADESVSSHVSGNLTSRSQSEPKKAHWDDALIGCMMLVNEWGWLQIFQFLHWYRLERDSHFACNVRLEFVLVETILIEIVDTL